MSNRPPEPTVASLRKRLIALDLASKEMRRAFTYGSKAYAPFGEVVMSGADYSVTLGEIPYMPTEHARVPMAPWEILWLLDRITEQVRDQLAAMEAAAPPEGSEGE